MTIYDLAKSHIAIQSSFNWASGFAWRLIFHQVDGYDLSPVAIMIQEAIPHIIDIKRIVASDFPNIIP